MNYRELRRQVLLEGTTKTSEHLQVHLKKKNLRPGDFSVRELCEAYMGSEWVQNLHPKSGGRMTVTEADGSAVAYADFSGITGQIFYDQVHEGYESEENVFSQIVPTKPTSILDMEKIPNISRISDEFVVIGEGEDYPNFGVAQDYQHRASLEKRGGIISVSKEAILGDKTGMLLERCQGLGMILGTNREKRIIDAFIDENATAKSAVLGGHRYHWNDTTYATHQLTSPWINVATSNGLVDHTDIENAWLKLRAILDPYTGEPINIRPKHLVVTPQNAFTAWRILHTLDVRTHAGGYAQTGNLIDTNAPSPVKAFLGDLQLVTSQQLANRAATDSDWWLGDLAKVVQYASLWEILPEEAPKWTPLAFNRDIVVQHKISEMGRAWVRDPRWVVESRA